MIRPGKPLLAPQAGAASTAEVSAKGNAMNTLPDAHRAIATDHTTPSSSGLHGRRGSLAPILGLGVLAFAIALIILL